jgi:fructose-specific phosphotransferase system IIC component
LVFFVTFLLIALLTAYKLKIKTIMKQKATAKEQKYTGWAMIFLGATGISYEIVREFVFHKPQSHLLGIMLCLLIAGTASTLRKKYTK